MKDEEVSDEGQETIGSRQVVTEKEKHDGKKLQTKTRLVARRCQETMKPQSDSCLGKVKYLGYLGNPYSLSKQDNKEEQVCSSHSLPIPPYITSPYSYATSSITRPIAFLYQYRHS